VRKKGGAAAAPPRGGGWKWLALAGLGAAAVYAASRLLESERSLPRLPPPEPEPEGQLDPNLDQLALPPDVAISHVPGPAGSLRFAERHPQGGLAIVFVHGLGGRLEQWAPVLHRLGPGIRAICFDLPGHGESATPHDGDLSVPALAAAIGAVAAAAGLRRFVLVGHSLGGLLAIDYAAKNRERVAGLFLADANGDASTLPQDQRESLVRSVEEDAHGELLGHWRQILYEAEPEVAERVLEDLENTSADTLAGGLAGSLEYSPLAALDAYGGIAEALVTPANSMPFSLHRLRPQLPVKTLMGASHWLMMDRPDEFCTVLWDFLDRVRR
jgi:pimeloyl-ACP methyl ester carboxylesterase